MTKLQEIRRMTEVSEDLERKIISVIGGITRLREQAASLTGVADRQMIRAMDRELSQVRRRLETFKHHAARGGHGSRYLIDRDDLAENVADAVDKAADYFRDEVSRADPSALRDRSRPSIISVRIDQGNDGSSRYAS
ncbi:hypothetical protein [Actinoplanes derwentensis]|uniref:hypothetical protein n=1 Tax=Actinoplanes derwentensis TaxID=113562 RepID=UPI0012FD51D0|nr:hypothetical protein [Actinoplanes derwentensis]